MSLEHNCFSLQIMIEFITTTLSARIFVVNYDSRLNKTIITQFLNKSVNCSALTQKITTGLNIPAGITFPF